MPLDPRQHCRPRRYFNQAFKRAFHESGQPARLSTPQSWGKKSLGLGSLGERDLDPVWGLRISWWPRSRQGFIRSVRLPKPGALMASSRHDGLSNLTRAVGRRNLGPWRRKRKVGLPKVAMQVVMLPLPSLENTASRGREGTTARSLSALRCTMLLVTSLAAIAPWGFACL
ncbi:hypothetical protein F5Y10DRAFT_203281 [Nemania abortiva]|nr:hypothetical protein F5Y10DRAFT_203281 [Nemania abortiva]